MRRVVLHTFQRTGRNFVLNAIKDIADIWIDSSQSSNLKDFGNYDKVVTIIRNPVESIVSLALMASRTHPDQDFASNVSASSSAWINFHQEANMDNSVFLNFKELESDPESFIKKILDISNINQVKDYSGERLNEIMKEYQDSHKSGFIISEKDSPKYKEVNEYVLSLDLSQHFDIYNNLIGRCV